MKCRLLRITDDYVGVPSPEASHIPEFKRIIERDDSENKEAASKELAYIYFMEDWESPYAEMPEERRKQQVAKDLFDKDWSPDEAVQKGREKYEDLYENDYIKMLNSARAAARKLRNHFESVDLTERDKNNKPVHKPKDLVTNLKRVGDVIEGINDLEELVRKNQTTASENRGGVETNKYSERE